MNSLKWDAKGTTVTQKELDKYLKSRSRPGTTEDLLCCPDDFHGFKPKDGIEKIREENGKPVYRLTHGLCPCAVCGHQYDLECYKKDCKCCSEKCT